MAALKLKQLLLLNWRRGGGGGGGGLGGCLRHGNAALPFPLGNGNRTTASSSACSSSSSSSNLFVGGLSYDTNETALKDAFSQYGDVIAGMSRVNVICNPTTGRSKGFGFVKFSSQNQAAAALHEMNGQVLDGRNIRVQYANGTGGGSAC